MIQQCTLLLLSFTTMFLGTQDITAVKAGGADVAKVYLGTDLIIDLAHRLAYLR